MTEYKILPTIQSPADVKKLSLATLEILCAEMRQAILEKVSNRGGHLGPNLGIIEIATALHYVFNSPEDKIVWDVSHQCYAHKMLTGRAFGFIDESRWGEISGFTAPKESPHDMFTVGHTSTSVSLACGLAKARDMQGGKEHVVAVIGDGSLSGGEAFEGLDNAGALGSKMLIVVNDNEMSIARNFGGLYGNLAELRRTNGTAACNYFKALGLEYKYVENGNNLAEVIEALTAVKDCARPVVLHVHTLKGKGYAPAETDKEAFHWSMPFEIASGKLKPFAAAETYVDVVSDYLVRRAVVDDKLAVINAATPGALKLKEFRGKYPEKYFDVGIAEEHATAFASALAKGGMKPVALFFGGFIQRAYDQIMQDLCLDKNPAVFVVENGGISGADVTHTAVQDIPMLSHIPNLVYLAPASKAELLRMLDWALAQSDFPVVIQTSCRRPAVLKYEPRAEIELHKSEVLHTGSRIALLGLGGFLELAEQTADEFAKQGYDVTVVNPRFADALDEALLEDLRRDHDTVITLEDGNLDGGFGEKVARFYGDKPVRVFCFGVRKEYTDRVSAEELYQRYELTPSQIVLRIL